MLNNTNEFKGYGLFNDVEDKEIQIYNRARTLVNIMEDHSEQAPDSNEKVITGKGALLCIGYFNSLPEDDRAAVHSKTAALILEKRLNK